VCEGGGCIGDIGIGIAVGIALILTAEAEADIYGNCA
jgi:hypothetical protein